MENNRTKIGFEYQGTEYTLEYTADALKKMERTGFKFAKLDEIALTATEELFVGAFIANHNNVPRKKRLEIWNALTEKDEESGQDLAEVLGTMLSEAVEELNTHQGNVHWTIKK